MSLLTSRDVRSTVDACADGTFQVTLYVGPNFVFLKHGDTIRTATELLAEAVESIERGEDTYLP